jgi:release factor glutamine methyltransferase
VTIAEALAQATALLAKHQIEWPHLEAEILLAFALKVKRIQLYIQNERVLSEQEEKLFHDFLNRRTRHEPTAYITGFQPFMSLDFFVDRSVLIPRPETEELVQVVSEEINRRTGDWRPATVADIGTGSGAIAVSLAKYLPKIRVIGTDSSAAALAIAQKNAEFHKVADRCQFLEGNLLEPLKEKVDIIVSNPPYVPTAVINTLQPEVKDWEPRGSLDGGIDGLDYVRRLAAAVPGHLKTNGLLLLELNQGQAEKAKSLAAGCFVSVTTKRDASDKERFLIAECLKDPFH